MKLLHSIEWALRINVALKLSIYGLGKIMGGQFHLRDKLPVEIATTPLSQIGSFDLAWTFFGYSNGYIWFIGLSQLIGSLLLLLPKTKLFGTLILIPILVNIIVVDITFEISEGALFSACFYLASLLIVLWLNKESMLKAIRSLLRKDSNLERSQLWKIIAISLVVVGGLFLLENMILNTIGR